MGIKLSAAFGSAVLLLLLTTYACPARADDLRTRQRLVGTVTTESGAPVEGASVKLKDLRTLIIRSYITQADGRFHFSNLSTEVAYEVWAEHDNRSSETRTFSRFDTDRILRVRLTIRNKNK